MIFYFMSSKRQELERYLNLEYQKLYQTLAFFFFFLTFLSSTNVEVEIQILKFEWNYIKVLYTKMIFI